MITHLYRKSVRKLYDRYTPIRRKKARQAMEYKKAQGFNQEYAPGSIPVSEIPEKLEATGIRRDDTVFVRISLSAASAFEGGVTAFLKEIMDYLTPEGTLVMSSYTFDKSPILFLADSPLFDPEKSTDRLNLVSELFRRTPGVLRSIHPTHSVCAYGKNAQWIVADHHKSEFCYGPDSPFARLYDLNAKEISIGVYPTSLTLHYIEQFVPENVPGFQDLKTPILCRIVVDGKEVKKPFRDTDSFADYTANYQVFEGTDAQPEKHFFGKNLDFHILDLNRQIKAMRRLVEEKKYWHTEPSRLKNIILKYLIKPLVLLAFFDRRNGVLHPLQEDNR